MNVKDLKELIKYLPDDTPVISCCESPLDDPSSARIIEDYEAYDRATDEYIEMTVVQIH